MLELRMKNRLYSYAFYALAAALFALALATQSGFATAVSVILLSLSALYFSSGHIVNNLLLKRGTVIEVSDGFRLNEELSAAVKRIGNEYLAVSCVLLRGAAGERDGAQIETIVSNTDFPFEFSLGLESLNHDRMLDALEEKRRLKEIEIARSDPKKYDRMNELRRELAVIESEIRSVRGEKLLALKMRLKTFAKSTGEFKASREASRNAEQLAKAFSAMLGLEHEMLSGERLLEELAMEGETA
jgi:hypothetical protein